LINKPQLLIADEPTSSLDQANRDAFMALLMSTVADNQMTLIFVSHDLSLSGYFSQVQQLSDFNQLEGAK
jgi:putative ABC transport system ATP-binding protein